MINLILLFCLNISVHSKFYNDIVVQKDSAKVSMMKDTTGYYFLNNNGRIELHKKCIASIGKRYMLILKAKQDSITTALLNYQVPVRWMSRSGIDSSRFRGRVYRQEGTLVYTNNEKNVDWIKIPTTDDSIVMWDTTAGLLVNESPNDVFPTTDGWVMVHHLSETDTPIVDMTSNNNRGIASSDGLPQMDTVSLIGSGQYYNTDGSGGIYKNIKVLNSASLQLTDSCVIEMLVKPATFSNSILDMSTSYTFGSQTYWSPSGNLFFGYYPGGYQCFGTAGSVITNGAWNYLVAKFKKSSYCSLFVNGQSVVGSWIQGDGTVTLPATANNLVEGRGNGSYWSPTGMDGLIDEVRISSDVTHKTKEWFTNQYLAMVDSLLTYRVDSVEIGTFLYDSLIAVLGDTVIGNVANFQTYMNPTPLDTSKDYKLTGKITIIAGDTMTQMGAPIFSVIDSNRVPQCTAMVYIKKYPGGDTNTCAAYFEMGGADFGSGRFSAAGLGIGTVHIVGYGDGTPLILHPAENNEGDAIIVKGVKGNASYLESYGGIAISGMGYHNRGVQSYSGKGLVFGTTMLGRGTAVEANITAGAGDYYHHQRDTGWVVNANLGGNTSADLAGECNITVGFAKIHNMSLYEDSCIGFWAYSDSAWKNWWAIKIDDGRCLFGGGMKVGKNGIMIDSTTEINPSGGVGVDSIIEWSNGKGFGIPRVR
ncbi:MAG: hypothetical protein PHX21_12785 [bacterium]|nr:hypothetical protein [bacterium]